MNVSPQTKSLVLKETRKPEEVLISPKDCKELLDLTRVKEPRIRMKNGKALFGDGADELVMVRGAITTSGRFHNLTVSLAHLMPDGVIWRYGVPIGSWEDIAIIQGKQLPPAPSPL